MRRSTVAPPTTATASRAIETSGISRSRTGQMRWERCASRKLAPPLAQVGEAKDRIDQIVIGAKLEGVHSGLAKRAAQFLLPPFGGCGETLAKAPIVRIDENLLAGFGILNNEEAEIRQLHFQRVVQAHGDNFVASRELRERFRPARRANEIGHEKDKRAALQDIGGG